MIVDPRDRPPGAMYQFIISVVVPRPIAFISTVGLDGRRNVSPFSFFNAISSEPPLVGIAITRMEEGPKDTLRNIRETGEFVANVVDESLSERMVQSSGEWPREVDEFELTGLTPVASTVVRAPRVGESPVSLECKLDREIELGGSIFVVGEVVLAHVRDDVLTDGRVDPEKLKPLGRLGGNAYAPLRDVLRISRPKASRTG